MAGVRIIVGDGLSALRSRTCGMTEVTFRGARGDKPKSNLKTGRERAANMRLDGLVPAAERSYAAGHRERLPCPKMNVIPWKPWGEETMTEKD